VTEARRGYTLDPVDSGGLLLGLGALQLAVLGAGGAAALYLGAAVGGGAGVAVAVTTLVGASILACWSIDRRPLVAWVIVAGAWLARRAGGVRAGLAPVVGHTAALPWPPSWPDPPPAPSPGRRRGTPRSWPPPAPSPDRRRGTAPAGIAVMAAPCGSGEAPMGIVRDRRFGTWAAVLAVTGGSFTLLDGDDQRRRLGTWGALLAGLSRPASPVARIQWLQRVSPAAVGVLDDLAGPPPGMAGPAAVDYGLLLADAAAHARSQDTLVIVAVRSRRGGSDPATVLRREIRLVQGQLGNADLAPGPPLDLAALTAAVRSSPGGGGPWPLATHETWSALRVDGAWHATFWIAEWPRVEVGPDFLTPLLLAGSRRVVSMTMAPVPVARAIREVESARTASLADDELRRRAGFLATARRLRQSEGVARREGELADGHAEYRFSGYVTVSGDDRATLEESCAEIESAAQAAHLDLRRLWGRQAEAFTWTQPLARGLA